jgi:hypothetical protein
MNMEDCLPIHHYSEETAASRMLNGRAETQTMFDPGLFCEPHKTWGGINDDLW